MRTEPAKEKTADEILPNLVSSHLRNRVFRGDRPMRSKENDGLVAGLLLPMRLFGWLARLIARDGDGEHSGFEVALKRTSRKLISQGWREHAYGLNAYYEALFFPLGKLCCLLESNGKSNMFAVAWWWFCTLCTISRILPHSDRTRGIASNIESPSVDPWMLPVQRVTFRSKPEIRNDEIPSFSVHYEALLVRFVSLFFRLLQRVIAWSLIRSIIWWISSRLCLASKFKCTCILRL